MLKYFKDSIKEFKHVNWPTRQETKLYLKIVVWVLTVFGIYLMIAGWIFKTIVFGLKDTFSPSVSIESPISAEDLNFEITTEGGDDVEVNVETVPEEDMSSTEESSQ